MKTIVQRIAGELGIKESQVQTVIMLLNDGATVPFIARYRKEATNGLDDTQLRKLEERLYYLRELDERRTVILDNIREQDKLTPELETRINEADTKARLEDLYLPYKPKRNSKAKLAKKAGLEPLALKLLEDPTLAPEEVAVEYINAELGIENVQKALEGARHILVELFAEDAKLLDELREYLWRNATFNSKIQEGKEEKGTKFSDYFDYHEPLKKVPSHRALAMFRGRKSGILQLSLSIEQNNDEASLSYCEGQIAKAFNIADQGRAADNWLLETVRSAWRFKIRSHLDAQLLMRIREAAEDEAIKVFSSNLQDLLLAAPAGPRVTMGLDPGIRTGVKIAIVDKTGKLLETVAIYPHPPRKRWQESLDKLVELAQKHKIDLISIGNGTGSRETDKLVTELIKKHADLNLYKLVISEAGASVYSASKTASMEFPDLDVSMRGAVSIARRLQDPLAELVKIEPKSIGVGQYQHDVNKRHLARSLDGVVEDCVNLVGVDINTASYSLLSRVSGLNNSLARNIVEYRDKHGAFPNREALKQVPRLGEKSFEQAAGFLRIMNGDNPLDMSSVHPEAYPVVERIIAKTDKQIDDLIGNVELLQSLDPKEYTDDNFGIPTVSDILKELEKPGRDPRPEFKTPNFKEGIEDLKDLEADMILEGVVTNVTNFGAFVDIGVHHDGLVHISALSETYVKDPRDIVKAGDVVTIKVIEIDLKRRRVALTMCLGNNKQPPPAPKKKRKDKKVTKPRKNNRKQTRKTDGELEKLINRQQQSSQMFAGSIMAEAFANARKG
ncbi:MAG TPA: RNA-binding transcriptional accessory protein [Thioploca sp.]|nr:RNA-binding transcriptional accessory protein [Thioploca sp.]